ncbi:MAG: cytochrome c [Gemmatimonadaceae bacterium]|nr:cytochrome c [Gemmatimonadaceae bacterium]
MPPRRTSRLLLATVSLALLPAIARAQDAQADADSLAAAAARQLDVGEQWFRSVCMECHATGNLTNPDFRLAWRGKSAFDLFERIRSTMPQNKPGTLTQGTYASIVAYLMKVNGLPVGTRRVSSDSTALASILLAFPAAAGTDHR